MSGLGRFASLVRFVVAANVTIVALPLAACGLAAWEFRTDDAYRIGLAGFGSLLTVMLLPMIATQVIAPWLAGGQAADANPLEFLMTRALDRRWYYRALTSVLLGYALLPSAFAFVLALARPELRVLAHQDAKQGRYLSAFPGSYASERDTSPRGFPVVVIPDGRLRMAVLDGVTVVVLTAATQAALLVLVRQRRRPWVAQGVMMMPAFVFVVVPYSWGLTERWMLRVAPHVFLVALALVPAFLAAQLLYERRFERLELVGESSG